MGLADFFWVLVWSFFLFAYIWMFILIITDLFRDDQLSGWLKALWIILLVVAPYLTALIYVIARGRGMAERSAYSRGGVVAEADSYVPAASSSPVDDITHAKKLLDAGTISQGEFEALKSKALGKQYFG